MPLPSRAVSRCYNVGLYLRLSVEDSVNSAKRGKGNPFQNESSSIENQRSILESYVRLQGWNATRVYADDGYAGGSFNRPAFQEMLQDAELGLIDLILVKDLSRLGRDYIEVGRYTDEGFPGLGVRFITLMDNIDSEGSTDILPFRSLLNDYHLKDLSRKIKSVLEAKAKSGTYVGAFAPYGYKKDPANKGRLVVDPYAAEIVRRIFDLRLQQLGHRKIACILNDDGILSPRAYCYQSEGRENPYKVICVWSDTMVKTLLCNEVYVGHSVKFKKGTFSYKKKRIVNRPEEDWIRVENTHEPIISQVLWDEVQGIDLKRYNSATCKTPEISLFSGLVFCDKGHPMICNTATKHREGKAKTYCSYLCSNHKQTNQCSWHTISELALLGIIQADVRRQFERITVDEERVVQEIQRRLSETSLSDIKKELRDLSEKLTALNDYAARLYEDRLAGAINLDTFLQLSAQTEADCIAVTSEHKRLASAADTAEHIGRWVNGIRRAATLEAVDREMLCALIERIEVGERETGSKGKLRRQAVRIPYRFVGQLE